MSDKLCTRKSDGTVWEPSHPDHWTDGHALAAVFSGNSGWYFQFEKATSAFDDLDCAELLGS